MPIQVLSSDLTSVSVRLDQIYLDPNNPRFQEFDWTYTPDSRIESMQDSVEQVLVKRFAVDKLLMNMEVNGYLPIDRVVIRQFDPEKYVVLEGNRRICAAKMLQRTMDNGTSITEEVRHSLETIPCLQYTGSDKEAAWLFQGLRHISGIAEWSAFNKAKLLVDQMQEERLTLTEVGKRFGLTRHGAGQCVRGYAAFKQAKEASDFVAEVGEESYPYFQELFSNSSVAVREWMEWNDQDYQFKNELNFNMFVGWLYPKDTDSEAVDADLAKGDWDRRRLVRRDDIRHVAALLRDAPDLFQQFAAGEELESMYSRAQLRKYEETARKEADPLRDVFDSIQVCRKALENIPYRAFRNDETKAHLYSELDALRKVISSLQG